MPAEVLINGPLALSDLSVEWDPAPSPLAAEARRRIDACWASHLADARASGRDLFNGSLLALRRFAVAGHRVTLTLAPSDYKTFLVTCLRDHSWFLAQAPNAIAPALGNSALLTCRTSACLGLRSQRVSAYPGKFHLFGGVFDTPDRPPTTQSLLAHLHREMTEELALSANDFAAPPTLLGLFSDPALHQPELVWHWPVLRPITNAHPHEHDAVFTHPQTQTPDESLFTPIALTALQTWRKSGPP